MIDTILRLTKKASVYLIMLLIALSPLAGQTGCSTDPVELYIETDNDNPLPGAQVCYSVKANNFVNIQTVSFTFDYNPSVLRYLNGNSNASGISSNNITIVPSGSGYQINYLLIGSSLPQFTLPDSTVIMEVCFEVIGDPADDILVKLTDGTNRTPTVLHVDDNGDQCPDLPTELNNPPPTPLVTQINCSCAGVPIVNLLGVCGPSGLGRNDGSISVRMCCGTAPYQVVLNGRPFGPYNSDEFTIIDITNGQQTFFVLDATGTRSNIQQFDVDVHNPIVVTNPTIQEPSCFDNALGAITLDGITGGTPFSGGQYLIGEANDVQRLGDRINISGLTNGSYSVLIQDSLGCQTSFDAVFNTLPIEVVDATVVGAQCSGVDDGSVLLTASGGMPIGGNEYRFFEVEPDGLGGFAQIAPIIQGTDAQFDNLSVGTHYFQAEDDSFRGSQPCYSPVLEVEIPARNNYSVDIRPLDTNTCPTGQKSRVIEIIADNDPFIGPFSYAIYDETGTLTGNSGPFSTIIDTTTCLAFGDYQIQIVDGNGACSITQDFTIDACNISYAGSTSGEPCPGENDGFINVFASSPDGAITYTWDHGPTGSSISGLDTGLYFVTMSDGICMVRDSVRLGEALTPGQADIFAVSQAACGGGGPADVVINIDPTTGPYEFRWFTDPTDPSGSEVRDTFTDLPTDTFRVTTNINLYVQIFDDVSTCSVDTFINVNVTTVAPPKPNVIQPFSNVQVPNCMGDSSGTATIELGPSPDYSPPYSFVSSTGQTGGGSSTFQMFNLVGGNSNYVLIYSDAGCLIDSVQVAIPEGPVLAIDTIASVIPEAGCFGDDVSVNLSATSGFPVVTYEWDDGVIGAFNIVTQGKHYITLNANGCTITDSIIVNGPDTLIAEYNRLQSDPALCEGELFNLLSTVSGGTTPYQYQWLDATGTPVSNMADAPSLSAGFYELRVTDSNGCIDRDTFTLRTNAAVEGFLGGVIDPSCFGEDGLVYVDTVIGGSPPYFFFVDQGAPVGITDTIRARSGDRLVQFRDSNGCKDSTEIMILQPDEFTATISGTDEIILGESTQLDVTAMPVQAIDTIYWTAQDGSMVPCSTSDCSQVQVTPTNTTSYTVNVINAAGCPATDAITVSVIRTENVAAPTIFSPNAVEVRNRVFQISVGPGVESVNSLRIFDRWGNLVHEELSPAISSDRYAGSWDGSIGEVDQSALASGVYVYVAQIKFLGNPDPEIRKGNVTVIR